MAELTEREQGLYMAAITADRRLGILRRWHGSIVGWGNVISAASAEKLVVLEAQASEAWAAYHKEMAQ